MNFHLGGLFIYKAYLLAYLAFVSHWLKNGTTKLNNETFKEIVQKEIKQSCEVF